MSKPVKYTVAVVLKRTLDGNEFLIVKRPENDTDMGGHWDFPATTLKLGELPSDGAVRICKEKLNCECTVNKFLGIMYQKRNSYDIFLMDIEVVLKGPSEPDVLKANSEGTKYVNQKWTTDPLDLMASAKLGSCCSSIFLCDRGLLNREDWVNSLEGSNIVG